MNREIVVKLRSSFEAMVQQHPDTGTEFWCARDLQMLLGYSQWRNFEAVIKKAITSCQTADYNPADHFARISKMVDVGSGAKRQVEDIALTRYACYLIAQNGDPSKDPIAFAQTYFAVQTRKQEVIERRLAEAERVGARKKLTSSERELSGIIFERLRETESFARIRSKGDQALFGGKAHARHEAAPRCARPQAAGRLPADDYDQGQGLRQRDHQLQHQRTPTETRGRHHRRACKE
jgi:DNA-damage-inducible protein D